MREGLAFWKDSGLDVLNSLSCARNHKFMDLINQIYF